MLKWLAKFDPEDVRIFAAFMVIVFGYAAYWLVSRSLQTMVRGGHVSPQMAGRLRGLLRLLALLITIPLALQQAGAFDNAWAVLSASVTAVAIGFFALWSVLSNMVCALLIVLFRPFRVGDEIELPDANSTTSVGGVVTDMNLLFVTLKEQRQDDRAAVIQVPNNVFFQRIVRRFSSDRRGESFFS